MQILDPTDETVPVKRMLAPRAERLGGTVGLLDINKARGDVMLNHVKRLLNDLDPSLAIKQYRKPTPGRPAPLQLRQKILEECDAVIVGLAD